MKTLSVVVLMLALLSAVAIAQETDNTTKNVQITKKFFEEVFNKGDISAADKYVANDINDHDPFKGVSPNLEGFKEGLSRMRSAFPDLNLKIDDIIASNDKVVVRTTATGTQKGEFMGKPATGKKISMEGIDILRLTDGKIVEHWGVEDNLAMMQQLGIISPPNVTE
jgi:steroid delta-isomerase-like uncharacterized protein